MNHPRSARRGPRLLSIAAALAAAFFAAPAEARTAADVPLPPPPPGTRLERRGATLGAGVGPWAAFDKGKSIALHLDYGFPRTPAGWRRLDLELRLAVMLARPTGETTLTRAVVSPYSYTPTEMNVGVKKTRVWVAEAVPTTRVRLPVGPSFAVFADGGLGLVQTVERYESEETFIGRTTKTQNVTGIVLRLGAGASIDATDRLRIVFLPLALSVHVGPKYGAYAPSLGLAYRM